MAAYGDALGARTEQEASAPKIVSQNRTSGTLSEGSVFYSLGADFNPWFIWPRPADVQSTLGVITDDTSWRMAIAQPWLDTVLASGDRQNLNTGGMKPWLFATDNTLVKYESNFNTSWYNESKEVIVACFVTMMNEADIPPPYTNFSRGYNAFYYANAPTCFGLYMYFDLAVMFAGCSSHETFSFFRAMDGLDVEYAGVVTGLLSASVADAVEVGAPSDTWLGDWFLDGLLTNCESWALLESTPAADREYLRLILANVTAGSATARELGELDATVGAFLSAYYSLLTNPDLTHQHTMTVFDPLVFARAMVMCSEFVAAACGEGVDWRVLLARTFQLLIAIPGDTDTMASQFGVIAGAYYGHEALLSVNVSTQPLDYGAPLSCEVSTHDHASLGVQFGYVDSYLSTFYEVDVRERAGVMANTSLFYNPPSETGTTSVSQTQLVTSEVPGIRHGGFRVPDKKQTTHIVIAVVVVVVVGSIASCLGAFAYNMRKRRYEALLDDQ